MNYHTHKLNSQNHSHIIDRQDSVTGDTIKANDEVVFCSVCQSVFLKESWEYMNKEHCNQTETLGFIPAQAKQIKARNKNALIFEILPDIQGYKILFGIFASIGVLFTCGVFSVLFTKFSLEDIQNQKSLKIIIFLVLSNLIFLFIMRVAILDMKKTLNIRTILLQVYENKIISFDKTYKWQDVESIIYTSHSFFSKIPNKLEIKLVNETLDIDLPSRYPYNMEFLMNIMGLSKSRKVTFYVSNTKELQFLLEKKQDYNRRNIMLINRTLFN